MFSMQKSQDVSIPRKACSSPCLGPSIEEAKDLNKTNNKSRRVLIAQIGSKPFILSRREMKSLNDPRVGDFMETSVNLGSTCIDLKYKDEPDFAKERLEQLLNLERQNQILFIETVSKKLSSQEHTKSDLQSEISEKSDVSSEFSSTGSSNFEFNSQLLNYVANSVAKSRLVEMLNLVCVEPNLTDVVRAASRMEIGIVAIKRKKFSVLTEGREKIYLTFNDENYLVCATRKNLAVDYDEVSIYDLGKIALSKEEGFCVPKHFMSFGIFAPLKKSYSFEDLEKFSTSQGITLVLKDKFGQIQIGEDNGEYYELHLDNSHTHVNFITLNRFNRNFRSDASLFHNLTLGSTEEVAPTKQRKQKKQREPYKFVNDYPDNTKPTLIETRKALRKSRDENILLNDKLADSDRLNRTYNNIEKRLLALEKTYDGEKYAYEAANFGAADASSDAFYNALMANAGHKVPCSTPEETAQTIVNVIEGTELHPKRFGDPGRSVVLKTGANAIINTSGANYTTGDTIGIIVVANAAYKGGVVASITPGSLTYKVLGYMTPDRDPEQVGIQCASLYTSLTVAAPMVIGQAAVSTMMIEMGVANTTPWAARAGKLYSLCRNRKADVQILLNEKKRLCYFNCCESEVDNLRMSAFDVQNNALVYAPNPQVTGAISNASSTLTGKFRIVANAFGPGTAISSGYASGTDIVVPASTTQVIWNLKNNSDFLRHLLFGDFDFSAIMNCVISAATNQVYRLTVTYSDASTVTKDFYQSGFLAGAGSVISINFSSQGNSLFQPKSSLMITDMSLSIVTPAATTNTVWISSNAYVTAPCITVQFNNVNSNSTYLVALITGVPASGTTAQFGITLETHTEVLITPDAQNATYVQPTDDLPYSPLYLAPLIRYHQSIIGSNFDRDYMHFSSSGFGKFLKKISSVGKKGLQLANKASPMIGMINPALGAALNVASNMTSKSYSNRRLQAASFGANEQQAMSSAFFFPAVDPDHNLGELVPVVDNGPYLDPVLEHAFGKRVGCVKNFTGRSGTLAMLCACLAKLGFPVKSGCYTGEVSLVSKIHTANATVVCFTLLPISEYEEKLSLCESQLEGLSPDGWCVGPNNFGDFEPLELFPTCKVIRQEKFLASHFDRAYPGYGYKVVIEFN